MARQVLSYFDPMTYHVLSHMGAGRHGGKYELSGGGRIADEFLELLALKARGADGRERPQGHDLGHTHENGGFTGELSGDAAAEIPELADDVLQYL